MDSPKAIHSKTKAPVAGWNQLWSGAGLVILVGLIPWFMPMADSLTFLSYDLPVVFKSLRQPQEVIMVYLDGQSFKELGQDPKNFNRTNHARVLRHLNKDGARLVVYDIWLNEERTPAENSDLAQAMRDHGRVVIASITEAPSNPYLIGVAPRPPLPLFAEAAAGVGLAQIFHDSVVRTYDPGTRDNPSLPWVAARVAGLQPPDIYAGDPYNHWINFQSPPGGLRSVPFSQVASQPAGTFSNKFVFIGSYPITPEPFDEPEEFRVPHSRFLGDLAPGAEIWAQAFLNLKNRNWWQRWPQTSEIAFLILTGLTLGWGFPRLTFRGSLLGTVALSILLLGIGFYSAWHFHRWFCWSLVLLAQMPVALGWSFWCHLGRLSRENQVLEERLVTSQHDVQGLREAAPLRASSHPAAPPGTPGITDHQLLRRIGRGAYGEVWLARNAVGLFHAVKIIHRAAFDKEEPYEREFRGIEKFMPISRQHPGLVHLLHVGRNDEEGWFYYVMETADDAEQPAPIHPETYRPKSLTTVLRQANTLPASQAIRLMIQLAEALDYLHEHRLIHRDIKPANIIFVRDYPKLADIGLVTDIAATGQQVTCVGTAGYMAPEGPGTPAADIYSLGKVIYEAAMGMDPDLFPELPTGMRQRPDFEPLHALNKIIGRACYDDVSRRYTRAADLVADLKRIQIPS